MPEFAQKVSATIGVVEGLLTFIIRERASAQDLYLFFNLFLFSIKGRV